MRRFRFFDHRRSLWKTAQRQENSFFHYGDASWPVGDPRGNEVGLEFSHLNSIYEIPANPLEKSYPAFKQGNYVVSLSSLGLIIILDRDLRKILWTFKHPDTIPPTFHDVQLLENGHLFFYNNKTWEGAIWYTTLDEYEPLTKKLVWRYRAFPPQSFAAEYGGGVQKLKNGNILFSDATGAGRVTEVTADGKIVWTMSDPFGTAKDKTNPYFIQDAKRVDLSDFLEHNHGY
jgi:hypothetical protein